MAESLIVSIARDKAVARECYMVVTTDQGGAEPSLDNDEEKLSRRIRRRTTSDLENEGSEG